MRIILPEGFSDAIRCEIEKIPFDVLRTAESDLARLFQLSARERRIVFVPAETLPEQNIGHEAAHGIIALDTKARTIGGFRKFVLPHLKEASGSQFERHITFLNGSNVEVMHVRYDDQKVQEMISIPRGTNEQFLHFSTHGLHELRSKGIVLAGFTRTFDGYLVERRPTAFHIFGVVLKGRLDYSRDGSDPEPIPETSTFLIPAGVPCSYRTNRPTDFLWLHIEPLAFSRGIGDALKASPLIVSDDLIDYCRHFRSEARNPGPDREAALSHLANLIELTIYRKIAALGMNLQADEARERLARALRTVEDALADNPSISDLARLAGVSTSRLYRDTQRYFNRSPGSLLEEIRMRHARELLLHSDYKLEKIAGMTGYSDAFSFSRAFKRLTGMAPSAFRQSGK